MKYDIAIVGNGIVGTLLAAKLSTDKNLSKNSITLIGPKNRNNSASMAAGAMHAVFGEIEDNFEESKFEKLFLQMGIISRNYWKKLISELNIKDAIISNDTIFYSNKSKNTFELDNFKKAVEISKKYNFIKNLSEKEKKYFFQGSKNFNDFIALRIKNEHSLNVQSIFKTLNNIISSNNNLDIIDHKVTAIDKKNEYFKISLANNYVLADKVICTTGFGGSDVKYNFFDPIPIIKGVGTAFLINNTQYNKEKCVIRTPNRGGSQCGLHIVPYGKNYFYVGAGNYLSTESEPEARLETYRYLIDLLQKELVNKKNLYKSCIIPLLGYRAKSLDNLPSIGSIKDFEDKFYYVSGCNRVGFTWSSYIVNEIQKWLNNKIADKIIQNFRPDRKLKSYGSKINAQRNFIKINIANLVEHSIVNKKNINYFKKKLKKDFIKNNIKIHSKYKLKIQLPPDLIKLKFSKLNNYK